LNLLGNDTDFGTSFSRAAQRDETEWTAGAVFSLPIPNRTARGNVNAARLSSTQALVELQRLEQQIVVQVDNASGQIITARQRIASTSEARVLARESLEAGQERLRAGTGTTFEVLELQRRLSETEFAEARARADYNRAVGEYHRQTGTTLRAHTLMLD
jgi:outer membrane protein TolC